MSMTRFLGFQVLIFIEVLLFLKEILLCVIFLNMAFKYIKMKM